MKLHKTAIRALALGGGLLGVLLAGGAGVYHP